MPQDPSGAPAPDQPSEAKVDTSPAVKLAPDEDVLSQPTRYVVSTDDAIEKVEVLLSLVKEGRPDLQQQVDQLLQQLDQLENPAAQAPAAAASAPTPSASASKDATDTKNTKDTAKKETSNA